MFDIVSIGSITLDAFIKATFLKTLKNKKNLKGIGLKGEIVECLVPGAKSEIEEPFFSVGGGAFNASVTFGRSGLKTGLLGNIGDDFFGRFVQKKIKEEKIYFLSDVREKDKTASSFVLIDKFGERNILVFRGSSGDIDFKKLALKKIESKWVYIASGNMTFSSLKRVVDYFYSKKTLIALSPSKNLLSLGIEKIRPILNKSKVVFLNREEGSLLTKISSNKKEEIFKKLDKYILGICVMTDGNNGVIVSDGRRMFESGVFKAKKIIDKTGAGDAFSSAFVLGLIESKEGCKKGVCDISNISYAIKKGLLNSAFVIQEFGATEGILTKKEFQNTNNFNGIRIRIKNIN